MPKKDLTRTIEQSREAARLRQKQYRERKKRQGTYAPSSKQANIKEYGITGTTTWENTQWTASSP